MALHLVDASPYLFRAYFALPDSLRDPAGNPVNAVYGFASFLIRLVAEETPTHLAIAFDGSLTTSFRNDLYPEYKAQRALPPPELEAQQDACREVAAAFGAAVFTDARYEADDLLATILAQAGGPAVVVTSDKDLAQLVRDDVALLDFAKGDRYGPAEVAEKFGVPPARIPDFLGLAGDTVDNIPGVKGVGKKTAAALIAKFGALEDLYARLDEVPASGLRGAKSLHGKLAAARDTALLSKRLATVAADAPVTVTRADLAWNGADKDAIGALFDRLGIGKLRDRVP